MSQPTSGVSASIVPKIAPVRSASRQSGRCSAAPLPIAAAKASVDIAKARATVETTFIGRAAPTETAAG